MLRKNGIAVCLVAWSLDIIHIKLTSCPKENTMRDVAVIGVGMNRFGKYPEKGIKKLVEESVTVTLHDAGVSKDKIEAAFVAATRWVAQTESLEENSGT